MRTSLKTRMRRRALVLSVLVAAASGTRVGPAFAIGAKEGAAAIRLEGQWDDERYGAVPWSAALRIQGTSFSGVVELPESASASAVRVEGTRVGDQVKFRIVRSDTQIGSFEGKVEGTEVIGSYVDAKGKTKEWSGAWRPESARTERDSQAAE